MIQKNKEINNLKIALLIDNFRVLGNLYKDVNDSYIFCIFGTEGNLYTFKTMTLEEVCTAYINTSPHPPYVPPQQRAVQTSQFYIPPQQRVVPPQQRVVPPQQLVVPPQQLTKLPKRVTLTNPYIIETTNTIIIDSTNHIKNEPKAPNVTYFQNDLITITYLETSVKNLLKERIVDNIILVDGLNVVRSSPLRERLFKMLSFTLQEPLRSTLQEPLKSMLQQPGQQEVIANCGICIKYINTHQLERNTKIYKDEDTMKTELDLYDKKSYYLLIHFLPYILTYVKINTPDISEYTFVICCKYQLERKDFTFNFYKNFQLVYIFVRSYGEDDDFLLLLLYSYFTNILKKNILILSKDNYRWWPDHPKIGDTNGYIYKKKYIDKSILD